MKISKRSFPVNLTALDSRVRMFSGIGLTIFAVYTQSYALLLLALPMQMSALTGHCIIYRMLGINQKLLQKSEMLALMPLNNPSPTLIFNRQGKRIFANQPAEKQVPLLTDLSIIDSSFNLENLLNDTQRPHTLIKEFKDRIYSFSLVVEPDKELIMAYAKDITDAVRADYEIIQTQKEVVYLVGEIGETRSKETGFHVKRVAEYSALLAQKIGLPEEEVQLIKMASPMHDIGKVGIPDRILMKPGKLDAEEWAHMQTHTSLGYNLLKHSDRPILKASAVIAQQHHEKFDGSGYPQGLKGNDIHLYARITAVADVFDALGSARVYKPAWPMSDIVAFFQDQRGLHFDPDLTDILLNDLDDFIAIRDSLVDA